MNKAYWNYRVVDDNGFFTIREIYYNKGAIEAFTINPIYPNGTNINSIKYDLDLMYKAFDKPILTLEEINKQIKGD